MNATAPHLALQTSLLASMPPDGTDSLDQTRRTPLAPGGWIDHRPGWLHGADHVFADLLAQVDWRGHRVRMYDQMVDQPRLSARLRPGAVPLLDRARDMLSRHYRLDLGECWLNLYRDGRDSVAWHGDRILRRGGEAIVAIVGVGDRRPFLIRPRDGGPSIRFESGRGDLLVMGGRTQTTWQHSIPKVARAGPRISITWRAAVPRSTTPAITTVRGAGAR